MIDNTFTNVDLDFIAAVWSHNNQANATATFDNICISTAPANCTTTTTWNGVIWDNGVPNTTTAAIINANYDTTSNGNITACSLVLNNGFILDVQNSTFVQIQNDVTNNGTINVTSTANFVQVEDDAIFTNNGTSQVNKDTAPKQDWFFYTYWGSPVEDATVETVFSSTPNSRRFAFDAVNYRDIDFDGIPEAGGFVPFIAGTLQPGIAYGMTENPSDMFPTDPFTGLPGLVTFQKTFTGALNSGDITIPIAHTIDNDDGGANNSNFNFIANPYPSALDFDAFVAANTSVDGVAYFWSQATPPSEANVGGDPINFSQNDYAIYNTGTGGVAGPSRPIGSTIPSIIPNQYIPSGQGFFAIASGAGTDATFRNSMRVAIDGAGNLTNDRFFGIEQKDITLSNVTSEVSIIEENRLWINLSTNNGIFNQVLIGYVNGATNSIDDLSYDSVRFKPVGSTAIIYTSIDRDQGNDRNYAIQGKAVNSIDENETIPLGFETDLTADIATTYTLSVDSFEGSFIENNTVYLRDELINITHNLSASDYNFTSEAGIFQDRFIIQFTPSSTLSSDEFELTEDTLAIIELDNGNVQFRVSNNIEMETIKIIDLTGRELYNFETEGSDNTYNLSNLNQSIYVAQVTLSNGIVISKKAIKRN